MKSPDTHNVTPQNGKLDCENVSKFDVTGPNLTDSDSFLVVPQMILAAAALRQEFSLKFYCKCGEIVLNFWSTIPPHSDVFKQQDIQALIQDVQPEDIFSTT